MLLQNYSVCVSPKSTATVEGILKRILCAPERPSDPDIACQTFGHTTQTPFNMAPSSHRISLTRRNLLPLEQTGVLVGIRGLECVDAIN